MLMGLTIQQNGHFGSPPLSGGYGDGAIPPLLVALKISLLTRGNSSLNKLSLRVRLGGERELLRSATTPLVRRRNEVFIRWIAPPETWVTLNTDGAAKGQPGHAGGGGLLRDHRGVFLRGFAANIGICSAYKAELMAAVLGLEMAVEMNIHKLFLQMDNQACIEGIKNADYQGGECFHILNKCRRLISSFNFHFRIVHCYREGNVVPDKLANLGVELIERFVLFEAPPHDITPLLHQDLIGAAHPRLIP